MVLTACHPLGDAASCLTHVPMPIDGFPVETTDYLNKRQNPVQNVPRSELNAMLCAVVHEFGEEWLKSPGDNPLQALWGRKDALATNELLLLGEAIMKGQAADSNWVKRHIDVIKSHDSNNRQGSLFELLAMSMFTGDGVQFVPAPKDNPGYDGTIFSLEDVSIKISLKAHGLSIHQRLFNTRCAEVETTLVSLLSQRKINAVRVIATATRYPGHTAWSLLNDNLSLILDNFESKSSQPTIISDVWHVSVVSFEESDVSFSSKFTSYTFHALSPYHKNENKNLLDKIDDACTNFSKCDETPNPKAMRLLCIHIPRSASVTLCRETAKQYFQDSETTPIAAILLYQTSISTIVETNTNSINHLVALITGPRYWRWVHHCEITGPAIKMNVFIGTVSIEPPQLVINKGKEYIVVDSMYTYQKGHLYERYTADNLHSVAAHIKNVGSGIFTHAVLNFPDPKRFVMNGVFAPDNELLLW